MTRQIVATDAAPRSPFYSQAVVAAGLVFVSGQAGHDPATGLLAGPTVQEQTRQSLANISAILVAAGSSLDDIVSATFILRDPADFAGVNEEWARWFPTDPPARQGAMLPVHVDGPVQFGYATSAGAFGAAPPGLIGQPVAFVTIPAVGTAPWFFVTASADLDGNGGLFTELVGTSWQNSIFVNNEGE